MEDAHRAEILAGLNEGDPVVTAAGFNPSYLLDALGARDAHYAAFEVRKVLDAAEKDNGPRRSKR